MISGIILCCYPRPLPHKDPKEGGSRFSFCVDCPPVKDPELGNKKPHQRGCRRPRTAQICRHNSHTSSQICQKHFHYIWNATNTKDSENAEPYEHLKPSSSDNRENMENPNDKQDTTNPTISRNWPVVTSSMGKNTAIFKAESKLFDSIVSFLIYFFKQWVQTIERLALTHKIRKKLFDIITPDMRFAHSFQEVLLKTAATPRWSALAIWWKICSMGNHSSCRRALQVETFCQTVLLLMCLAPSPQGIMFFVWVSIRGEKKIIF